MLDAVVLAGGTDRGELAAETGIVHRPLLEVGGRPIVLRVLGALRGSASVGRVALVAPDPVQAAVGNDAVDIRVPAADQFLDNLLRGIAATSAGAGLLLVLTGDLPLISPAAINDLVQQSLAGGADDAYPIIPRDSCERQFPGGRRTYVRLRDGVYTGGNGVVVRRDFLEARSALIAKLFAARKNPLRLAAMFGPRFVLALLAGRLTLAALEARASRLAEGRVAAVISTYAELAFDVDKPDDLRLARDAASSRERR